MTKLMEAGVLRVGDGRGFRVGDFVITAAHCLPQLPPCNGPFGDINDLTYPKLIGRLGGEPLVWAQVAFVDPVSDLAILREPDGSELSDQWMAYHELLDDAHSFSIADIETDEGTDTPVSVLSLGGKWIPAVARHFGGPLALKEPITQGGMSGSPVLDESGNAIGVVCSGAETVGGTTKAPLWSVNCRLMRSLPRWFDV
jgi:hypothetical protein